MNKTVQTFISKQIGYSFQNEKLLEQAFTRRSYSVENGGQDNEILEFLGDKVLDYCITKKLSDHFGKVSQCGYYTTFKKTEGDLSNLRRRLVESSMLAHRIDILGFSSFLTMGNGDKHFNIQNQQRVKEDLFESILGAIAIDCEWNTDILCQVVDLMLDTSHFLETGFSNIDYVEEVQKWCQKNQGCLPCYEFSETAIYAYNRLICGINNHPESGKGPHTCQLNFDSKIFIGHGNSQTKARREAAKLAYEYLDKNNLLIALEKEIEDPCLEKAINQLQELAQKGYFSMPAYKFDEKYDNKGNPYWSCICSIAEYNNFAESALSKKEAKKHAAYSMLLYILNTDSNSRRRL